MGTTRDKRPRGKGLSWEEWLRSLEVLKDDDSDALWLKTTDGRLFRRIRLLAWDDRVIRFRDSIGLVEEVAHQDIEWLGLKEYPKVARTVPTLRQKALWED